MFAIRPNVPYVFGTKKTDRTTTMTEAGPQHAPDFEGIDGTLGHIDPIVFGIDRSEFASHSGSVGAGSSAKNVNYPLSGAETDALLARSSFHDAIRDQIMAGKTAAKLVNLHDNLADYIEALYRDSLDVRTYLANTGLEGEALEAARRKFAEQKARNARGFTNRNTGVVHIYTAGTPAFVTIHEMIHSYTHSHVYNEIVIVEGVADYFTEKVCAQNGIPFVATYADELAAMRLLARTVGDTNLANYTFKGAQEEIRTIVDMKGEDTWKQYKAAVNKRRFGDAAELLRGAKGIYDAKTALDAETERMKDNFDRATTKARNEHERASWGPEGKSPIELRPMSTRTLAGQPTLAVERGGKHGIREHWSVTVKTENGSTLPSRIVALESNRTYVSIPEAQDLRTINSVNLSPNHD